MTTLLAFYIPILLLVLGYVVVNVYHLIRFRLPLKGDASVAMLWLYVLVTAGLVVSSIFFATIAYSLST